MSSCVNPRVDLTDYIGTHGDHLRRLYFRGRIAARSGDPIEMENLKESRTNTNKETNTSNDGDMTKNYPFRRNGLMARSPPTASMAAIVATQDAPVDKQPGKILEKVAEANSTPHLARDNTTQLEAGSSPRLEMIYKMRKLEEDSIAQCRAILRKMKQVILRQRNVSNDIKEGVSELAEQFDVVERYRKSWKETEKERRGSQLARSAEKIVNVESETPITSGKRVANSPAENTPTIGKKECAKEPQTWQMVQKKGSKNAPSESKEPAKDQNDKRKEQKRPRRTKPEAVLIKPAEGNSYADVLKNPRTRMQPNKAAKVKGIRKTRTGDLLL